MKLLWFGCEYPRSQIFIVRFKDPSRLGAGPDSLAVWSLEENVPV
jgi:hypothetical protein